MALPRDALSNAHSRLVTKTDHCLNEILWRTKLGEMPIKITSVIGNRDNCQKIAEQAGIPFHQINLGW